MTHVTVATIHLDATSGNIKLNDDPYTASKYNVLWSEVRSLQAAGITVLGMLGGAVQGSFGLLDGDDASFNHSYSPLREMLAATGFNGIDLDVEEPMSLSGIVRLIGRLKNDFGSNIIVTLAPVATALRKKKDKLSGLDYEGLEKISGTEISWCNTQFYCGWGSMADTVDYDNIIPHTWPHEKVVAAVLTNQKNCNGWMPDAVLFTTLKEGSIPISAASPTPAGSFTTP